MKTFLIVVLVGVLLLGATAGVGMWRGWFSSDTEPKDDEIVGYVNGGN